MSIINYINILTHPFETIANIVNASSNRTESLLRQEKFDRVSFALTNFTLNSVEMGTASEKIASNDVVVSLTTYGRRIHDVYLAIESIMQGTVKPNKIILWLSEEEFGKKDLPITLQKQQIRGLEIKYCKDIRSYKKLVYTLKEYPEACIITIDDDLIYNFDLVENLLNCHKQNPSYICASRIHQITKNSDGSIKKYLDWNGCAGNDTPESDLNFFTTGGGTLFPPHAFPKETFNEDVFTNICPTADDVWFNAMARLKGTKICKSFTHSSKGEDFIVNENLQTDGLNTINNAPENNQNDVQIKAVFENYGIMI